jgi:hypothetical protein
MKTPGFMRSVTLYAVLLATLLWVPERTGAQDAPHDREAIIHIAQSVAVRLGKHDEFHDVLKRVYKPLWQKLVARSLLERLQVFEVIHVVQPVWDDPAWDYLFLARLPTGVKGSAYLAALREELEGLNAGARKALGEAAVIRRTELMVATPNSYYPTPSQAPAVGRQPFYFIEYINVTPKAAFLDEYRESMKINSGPTLGELVDKGLWYNFVALETVSIESADSEMPAWNQVHIAGFVSPWHEDVAVEAFDSTLRRVNPEGDGYEAVFGRLDEIRKHTRVDLARELLSLTVGI